MQICCQMYLYVSFHDWTVQCGLKFYLYHSYRYCNNIMLFIVCAVIFWGKIIVLWTKIAKNWENVIYYVISSIKSNIKENTFNVYWKKYIYTSMQLSFGVKKWFFHKKKYDKNT